jgi:hypothetical protein
MQFYDVPIIKDIENMSKNGFHYSGENQLTIDQYNIIEQYDGDEYSGEVDIISLNPPTIKYNFYSLIQYDFLTLGKSPYGSFSVSLLTLANILIFILGIGFLIPGVVIIVKKEEFLGNEEE